MIGSRQHTPGIPNTCLFLIVCLVCVSVCSAGPRFSVENKDSYVYPGSRLDAGAAELLKEAEKRKFPAADVMVESRSTTEPSASVIQYYSGICSVPPSQQGNHILFIFSYLNNQPAARIEIYPQAVGKIAEEWWPTRIDLFFIRPRTLSIDPEKEKQILQMLKKRLGIYCYPNGRPAEEHAERERRLYDQETEIYILDTTDDFETVHLHFRRLVGAFYVRTAMDEDLLMRGFEIDISKALPPEEFDKKVVLIVEENPVVPTPRGAARPLSGHVFITYYIWKRSPEEIKELRLNSEGD